jgi:hypothetical protein
MQVEGKDSKTLSNAVVEPDKAPVELDLSDFLYKTFDANSFLTIKNWSMYFDEIPVDPYVQQGYRFKAIAWIRVKHDMAKPVEGIDEHIGIVNKLSGLSEEQSNKYLSRSKPDWHSKETGYSVWNLPQYAMQQSIQYNPVLGGKRREYPRINKAIIDSEDFHRLLIHYAQFFGWSDAIVLVQFQRVDCLTTRVGQPTIEGFHQDVNRHVGMLVVDLKNITSDSGVSQYVMDDNGKKTDDMIFNHVLQPGKLIYWNDKKVWHYGSELKVEDDKENGGRGTRDIIIMSAKTPPANMPMGPTYHAGL